MSYADAIKGYLIQQSGGSYRFTIVKRGQPVWFSRNSYPTHCMAEQAAIRYQKRRERLR